MVVLVMDTVRADRIGRVPGTCPATPVFDELARQSLVFENASSTSSWTLPAHASLFSGLYPYQHGVHWRDARDPGQLEAGGYCAPLPSQVDTLAEVLSRSGYTTLAVSANYWLTEPMGFAQGFDEYHLAREDASKPHQIGHKPYMIGERIVERALKLLDVPRPQPFFLFVNLLDPHAPYYPEAGCECASADPSLAAAAGEPLADGNIYESGLRRRVNLNGEIPPPAVRARLEALYDDEIAYTDQLVGRLVEYLDSGSAGDDTVLVVLSDHGESFFIHGMVNHGLGVYEETIRVPMLIRAPGRVPVDRVTDRVELIDVMPTLLELAGLRDVPIAQRAGWFGVNLLDEHSRHLGRGALAETYRNPWEEGLARPELLRTTRATVLDDWKLISEEGVESCQLYDLRVDPDEQRDLWPFSGNDIRKNSLVGLEERLLSGPVFHSGARATPPSTDLEALKALGYVMGDTP